MSLLTETNRFGKHYRIEPIGVKLQDRGDQFWSPNWETLPEKVSKFHGWYGKGHRAAEITEMVCWQKLLSWLHFVRLEMQIFNENRLKGCNWNFQYLCTMMNRVPWTLGHTFENSRDVCFWSTTRISYHVFYTSNWTTSLQFWLHFTKRSIQTITILIIMIGNKHVCCIVKHSMFTYLYLSGIDLSLRPIESKQPKWCAVQILHSYYKILYVFQEPQLSL